MGEWMGATEDTRARGCSSQSACGGGAKVARGCRAESGALLVPQCCQVLSSTKQSKAKQIGRQYGVDGSGCGGSGCEVSLLQPQVGGVAEEEKD